MQKIIFLITEVSYQAAHLISRLNSEIDFCNSSNSIQYKIILRNHLGLDRNRLTQIHDQLAGKKNLTSIEMAELRTAYKGDIGHTEEAMIMMYGIPPIHALSLPCEYLTRDLNTLELQNSLATKACNNELSAIIFLDCMLKPWWLEIFDNRIVNAHSAILPYARGMHAIEQIATLGDAERFRQAAGASLHYIDSSVDMGLLITTKPLDDLWHFENIWQVKAASYITAFELVARYLNQPTRFSITDARPYTETIGPVFKAREFTDLIRKKAVAGFEAMQIEESSRLRLKVAF